MISQMHSYACELLFVLTRWKAGGRIFLEGMERNVLVWSSRGALLMGNVLLASHLPAAGRASGAGDVLWVWGLRAPSALGAVQAACYVAVKEMVSYFLFLCPAISMWGSSGLVMDKVDANGRDWAYKVCSLCGTSAAEERNASVKSPETHLTDTWGLTCGIGEGCTSLPPTASAFCLST